MSIESMLGHEVSVSDPVLMDFPGLVPNGEPPMFHPLSTMLIYGDHEAVLAEALLTVEQGKAVGDWVAISDKKLTHALASHGDHWVIAGMLVDRFGAQIVALPGTIDQMRTDVAALPLLYDKLWPGLLPQTTVTVPGNRFTLEGDDVVGVGHSDTVDNTMLHIHDLGLVSVGEAVYNGVQQFLGESAGGSRDAWRAATNTVENLGPHWVVASHQNKELDDDAARAIAQTASASTIPISSGGRTAPRSASSTTCLPTTPNDVWARLSCGSAPKPFGWRSSKMPTPLQPMQAQTARI